jgi:hypothetical protein
LSDRRLGAVGRMSSAILLRRMLGPLFSTLLRDKTRPLGKAPLPTEIVKPIVDLTLAEPPGETTHWTGRAMAEAAGPIAFATRFAAPLNAFETGEVLVGIAELPGTYHRHTNCTDLFTFLRYASFAPTFEAA